MNIKDCDLHTRFQQIEMLDTETREVVERRLEHESGEARRFYEGLKEPVLVGIESTGVALEGLEFLRVAREFIGQELQRNESPERGVLGLINDTHAPATKFFENPIMRNRVGCHLRGPYP